MQRIDIGYGAGNDSKRYRDRIPLIMCIDAESALVGQIRGKIEVAPGLESRKPFSPYHVKHQLFGVIIGNDGKRHLQQLRIDSHHRRQPDVDMHVGRLRLYGGSKH